ncbi:cytochrome b561 [Nitzschia inconspicua]|uniref:Cytochrome b561 n=1 Tax=Nitzschia inconspicua TaxID=303405 RepID=A0A9K3LV98_9STRA|nr:cytochrome b561 [Nitzschia inconspicua]
MASKPSSTSYQLLVLAFAVYAVGVGYFAATRPNGKWRSPFSWHPFLMTVGMVGCMGIGSVTKKLGGYTNTKLHGMLASGGFLLALGGFYAIYRNKNLWEKPHFTTVHGKAGLALLIATVGPMLFGVVFLHPDWGLDKTNKDYRKLHKMFSRICMGCSWCTALYGMYSMTKDPVELAIYGVPLLILAPFTLV